MIRMNIEHSSALKKLQQHFGMSRKSILLFEKFQRIYLFAETKAQHKKNNNITFNNMQHKSA